MPSILLALGLPLSVWLACKGISAESYAPWRSPGRIAYLGVNVRIGFGQVELSFARRRATTIDDDGIERDHEGSCGMIVTMTHGECLLLPFFAGTILSQAQAQPRPHAPSTTSSRKGSHRRQQQQQGSCKAQEQQPQGDGSSASFHPCQQEEAQAHFVLLPPDVPGAASPPQEPETGMHAARGLQGAIHASPDTSRSRVAGQEHGWTSSSGTAHEAGRGSDQGASVQLLQGNGEPCRSMHPSSLSPSQAEVLAGRLGCAEPGGAYDAAVGGALWEERVQELLFSRPGCGRSSRLPALPVLEDGEDLDEG